MTKLGLNHLGRFALLLALPIAAFSADSALLQMMMPDAQALAGLQVASARNSPLGQYVLAHMTVDDIKLEQFISATGFDPRRDVSELMFGTTAKQDAPDNRWIMAAHGTFDVAGITAAAQNHGGALTTYDGVQIITHTGGPHSQVPTGLAFLDSSTALFGDLNSVQAAIDRTKSNASVSPVISAQAQSASAGKDFWFVTLAPLSNFSSQIPSLNGGTTNNNNFLEGINQASGGVSFGNTVTLSAQAVSRSPQDAQSLVDVLKFFVSLAQLNRQRNPAAGQLADLLDTLQTSVSGNTTSLSLAIPEPQVEQLLDMAHAQHLAQPHRAKAAAAQVY